MILDQRRIEALWIVCLNGTECRFIDREFYFPDRKLPNARAGMPPGKAVRRAASQSRSIENEPFNRTAPKGWIVEKELRQPFGLAWN